MIVKLQTEHHLKFLSLKGGCTGSSESTLVKMPHCWESHVTAHKFILTLSLKARNMGESSFLFKCLEFILIQILKHAV